VTERKADVERKTEDTATTQYLAFFLAGDECAIGILRVKEIIEFDSVTRVPATPPWVRGVMNLRGSVVPVIDLAVKFGLPPSTVTRRTCIVVVETDLEGERVVMGVMADSVSQVLDVAPEDIEPAPAFGTSVRVDYLLGLGRLKDRFVLLLDIDRVLSAAELLKVAGVEPVAATADAAAETQSAPGH
jgi:purine-binding chemotaxis protein CheW